MANLPTLPVNRVDIAGAYFLATDDDAEICRIEDATDLPPVGERIMRVLVVDDYADYCETTAMLLRRWGHEVRVASDGVAALKIAGAWQPDVVLADIVMPLLNGYGLARQLRLVPSLQQTLLVAVSGYADECHRRQGLEAGFNLYLSKPVMPSRLQQLLCFELNSPRMGAIQVAPEPAVEGPLHVCRETASARGNRQVAFANKLKQVLSRFASARRDLPAALQSQRCKLLQLLRSPGILTVASLTVPAWSYFTDRGVLCRSRL